MNQITLFFHDKESKDEFLRMDGLVRYYIENTKETGHCAFTREASPFVVVARQTKKGHTIHFYEEGKWE